jgi:hypothetical protein
VTDHNHSQKIHKSPKKDKAQDDAKDSLCVCVCVCVCACVCVCVCVCVSMRMYV